MGSAEFLFGAPHTTVGRLWPKTSLCSWCAWHHPAWDAMQALHSAALGFLKAWWLQGHQTSYMAHPFPEQVFQGSGRRSCRPLWVWAWQSILHLYFGHSSPRACPDSRTGLPSPQEESQNVQVPAIHHRGHIPWAFLNHCWPSAFADLKPWWKETKWTRAIGSLGTASTADVRGPEEEEAQAWAQLSASVFILKHLPVHSSHGKA